MAKRRVLRYVVGVAAALGLIVLGVHNWKTNSEFWKASAVNCFTLAIALLVSYHLVQRQNDRRKQKEILLDLIYKLQGQIACADMYNLIDLSKEELTMRNRSIGNKIHILEQKKSEFGFSNEVEFILERFNEYSDLIGAHIEDPKYLQQSKLELKRPLDLIDGKLTEMAMRLFE